MHTVIVILFFLCFDSPCTTGLLIQYTGLVYHMFWIFHIVILFWRIVFPFHARTYETRGYFRYVHIVMVIAAIVLPLESVGVLLGTGGLIIPRFPPISCYARETDASFFAFVLPITFISATGVSLLVIILWVISTKVGNMKAQSEVSESDDLFEQVVVKFLGITKYNYLNQCYRTQNQKLL